MLWIALKMLMEDRGKYLGMLAGVFFSALVITQQSSIFVGIMSRTFGFISDVQVPDLWVMDSKVQYIDDVKPLQDTQLYRVRSVEGVDWAVPLYKGMLKVRLSNGMFQNCNVIGLDDATMVGGPPRFLSGQLSDLRQADSVLVDIAGARGKLAKPSLVPGGPSIPLKVGDTLELNDHRAVVAGIVQASRAFQSQPLIYTTYSRATTFAPRERKLLSFILVKAKPGVSLDVVKTNIKKTTRLAAYTADEFKDITVRYFLKYTGIPINFGIAVALGLIIGTAIVGQTFYNFTTENLRYFGTLRALGATPRILLQMVIVQASVAGIIGYGLGVGAASLTRFLASNSELAFRMPWQLLAISASGVTLICIIAALISMRKVLKLEPAIVFRS